MGTTKPKDQAELDQETPDSKGKDDEPPPPPFAGLKLKPKRPVQRKPIEEPKKDTPFKVELKHHEFEKPPQTEEVEMECSILLGNAIVDKKVKLAKKEKYKKKVPKKAEDLSSEIETTDEVIDEVVESIETDETPQKPSTPTPTTTETNQSVKLPVKTKGKQELLSASKEESESPFGGIKLKKAQTGKRELDEAEVEKITLKHYEFEQVPLEEEPEKETGVILSNPIMDDKKPKTKRPKVPKLKTDSEPKNEQVPEEKIEEGNSTPTKVIKKILKTPSIKRVRDKESSDSSDQSDSQPKKTVAFEVDQVQKLQDSALTIQQKQEKEVEQEVTAESSINLQKVDKEVENNDQN